MKICLTLWIGKVKLLNNSEIDTKFLQLLQSTSCDIHEWCYYISTTSYTGWKISNLLKEVYCLKVYFLVMSASKKLIQIPIYFLLLVEFQMWIFFFLRAGMIKKDTFKQGTYFFNVQANSRVLSLKNPLFTYFLIQIFYFIWKEKESIFLKFNVEILNHPVAVHVIIHGHILFKKEEASPVSSPTTQTEL